MGNKFNKTTTMLKKPKVCPPPPPPPPPPGPPPPIITPCCPAGTPQSLNLALSSIIGCAGVNGKTAVIVYEAASGKWKGNIVVGGNNWAIVFDCIPPPNTIAGFGVKFTGTCAPTIRQAAGPTSTCSPFHTRHDIVATIPTCPAVCPGPIKQFRVTIDQ